MLPLKCVTNREDFKPLFDCMDKSKEKKST